MLHHAADRPARGLGLRAVDRCEDGLAVLPKRDVQVHRAARLAVERLGHEGRDDAVASADLADAVLHAEGLVGRPDRVAVVEVHFALCRAVLDVRALDIDEAAQTVQQLAEGGLEVVGLRQGVALDAIAGRLSILVNHVELDLDAD